MNRQNILEDLYFAVENGFDYYEIQAARSEKDLNLEAKTIKEAKKIFSKNNISLNLHSSYFISPSSLQINVSKTAFKTIKEEIILANKIGAKQITIHSGSKEILNNEAIIAKNFEILIKNLKKIVKFGKKYGIKIGLENSLGIERLCRTPEDLLKVVNSVKELGITFDIGHANAAGFDLIQFFKKIKNFIINIHLHDNNGKSDEHIQIGKGNINFKNFLRECKKSGYYGPFILEIFPCEERLKGKEIFFNIWNQV